MQIYKICETCKKLIDTRVGCKKCNALSLLNLKKDTLPKGEEQSSPLKIEEVDIGE